MNGSTNTFILRLHFVRHGEAEANASDIVLGQSESPLSILGIKQAKALSDAFSYGFWRKYCSDFERTQKTAELILGAIDLSATPTDKLPKTAGNYDLIIDKRLREQAKGVREGKSKELSYDEAMRIFTADQKLALGRGLNPKPLPKLETEEEVWNRVEDWINYLLADTAKHHINSSMKKSTTSSIYNVLVVSHSATIRTTIEHMVGDQLPSKLRAKDGTFFDNTGRHIRRQKAMLIPNTSVTIIDVVPTDDFFKTIHLTESCKSLDKPTWTAKLIELTNAAHLQGLT